MAFPLPSSDQRDESADRGPSTVGDRHLLPRNVGGGEDENDGNDGDEDETVEEWDHL